MMNDLFREAARQSALRWLPRRPLPVWASATLRNTNEYHANKASGGGAHLRRQRAHGGCSSVRNSTSSRRRYGPHVQSEQFMRADLALGLLITLLSASIAIAQVSIDVSKVTCD